VNRKPVLIALAGVVILIAAIAWAFRGDDDGDRIVLQGNVDIRQVQLAFTLSERVATMQVQEGDAVRAGQVVATLETRTLELQRAQLEAQRRAREQALRKLKNGSRPEEIAQAEAGLVAARAEVTLARDDWKRLQAIADKTGGRGVPQQDLDRANSRLRVAEAQAEQAAKSVALVKIGPREEDIAEGEAALAAAEADLALLAYRIDQSSLVAPSDAVVRSRLLEPGDMAGPQRPAFALALTSPKWVRAYLSEPDLGRIRPGMPAEITTDSAPDAPIAGTVGYIASVAEFTPKYVQTEDLRTSLVYEVRVRVDDADDRLRLGMPATVTLDPVPAPAASGEAVAQQ